jgi:hypothetical protein
LIHDTCQNDPELAHIVDAWPTLPDAIKAGIVAMVKAASGKSSIRPDPAPAGVVSVGSLGRSGN